MSRPWSRTELAARIDHTLLDPAATQHDILMACEIARRNHCATVCLNSNRVAIASHVLAGTDVGIAAVVGFPFGASHIDAKAHEAALAIADGATEIDMVLDIGRLKDGQLGPVRADIASVVGAAGGHAVKVILECARLTDDEKRAGCALAVEAGAVPGARGNTGVSGVLGGRTNADGTACLWLVNDGDPVGLMWPPRYSAHGNPLTIFSQSG